MRRAAMMIMLILGLTMSSTVGASGGSTSGSTIEIEELYGLPFNRAPYYRRGPRPPAVREHSRYYRPGKQKIKIPFEREGYLVLPRRKAPRTND